MKKYFALFLVMGFIGLAFSCTDFKQEEPGDLGGVSVNVKELSFNAGNSLATLTVKSGERWEITAIPEWLLVSNLENHGFSWTVSFSAAANTGYDRSGTLTFKSNSSSASVAVSQKGEKGTYEPVASVTLSPQSLELVEGETKELKATVLPENASNKNVRWQSSSTSIATVSDEGVVKAVGAGSATITVTTEEGGFTATCQVTVNPKTVAVKGVTLDRSELQMYEGESYQLTATVNPSTATNRNVSWKSNAPAVATVTAEGLVKAIGVGSATITVTTEEGEFTATCQVTVASHVKGVSLNKTEIQLNQGNSYQLTATVTPADAANQKVTWKSDSEAVATVSSNGLVTAKSKGTATITVTTEDGGFSASCNVTVLAPVTGVSLNKTEVKLKKGETCQLTATVTPSNAVNKKVSWKSSSSMVALVSDNGLVTAMLAGTTTITATTEEGGFTASCLVTVVEPVTGVSLNKSEIQLNEGESYQLTAAVRPTNATDTNVSWKSSNASVATVTANGLVTAKTEGAATITVTTQDGGFTAQCAVTVSKITQGVENGHEWVDLGLSVKWATFNVGAASPSAYGNYYAWGETTTKSDYSWETYKWCNGTEDTLTKYNGTSTNGTVDNKTQLDFADDAARQNWGGKWRMPTKEELDELYTKCTCTWTTQSGKKGYLVTSKTNGNSIFLPAAGYLDNKTTYTGIGLYWASNRYSSKSPYAYCLAFDYERIDWYGGYRCYGLSVRPVLE